LSRLSRAFPPGGYPLETLVDSVTGFPRKRHSSGGAIWLRTVLLGVLLALLVPALAMAETAVAQEPATAAPAATPAATEPTPGAPAADQATPADTTAPADATAPGGTATPADTTTPAPPPSTGTRPVSPPTLVELQPGTVVTTTPTTTTPATPAPLTPSAPATPEAVPAALPTAPDAPRTEAPKPVAAPVPDQSTEALPTSQSAPLAVALGSGPDASAAAAATAAAKDRALRSDAAAAAAVAAGPIPSAGFTNPISLERSAPSVAAPTRRAEGPADFGLAAETTSPFDVHLEAQGGPAPAGSSLLAVLASYVLPGGGSLPVQSTLFLFVQLAVILAFALAPRPGSGERLVLWGLLRPQAGHRLAVRRPG
jgi:hypothetical protein